MQRVRLALALVGLGLGSFGEPSQAQQFCSGPVHGSPLAESGAFGGNQALYVVGTVPQGGSDHRVATFDGSAWTLLPGGFDGAIAALAETSLGLVVGGSFTSVDGVAAARVARFDGVLWQPLGAGIGSAGTDEVRALLELGGELYAGGIFATAGGTAASNIARFDGAAWQPLGPGLDGRVEDLATFAGNLVAAGSFSGVGGAAFQNVGRWDGLTWAPLAPTNLPAVFDLERSGDRLYAAAGGVYRFGGVDWSDLGQIQLSTSIAASTVAVRDGVPFAAGEWKTFCQAFSGGPCLQTARLVGGIWQQLGHDELQPVLANLSLATFQGAVYQSGSSDGLTSYSAEPHLSFLSPSSALWYEDRTISLWGSCFDPVQPATVTFGSSPPLLGQVQSANQVQVTIPAGHLVETGQLDVTFDHAGTSVAIPGGLLAAPGLTASVTEFIGLQANLMVSSGGASGTAWLLWSPNLAGPLTIPGVHGSFGLDPLFYGVLGTVSLSFLPSLAVPIPAGAFPSGTEFHAQAAVLCLPPAGPQVAFSNTATIVLP
ncbi:IPT/TIG domain-containing protein [Engelhardtia mirabilis]|uniref:Cortical protein marker for cell polarity n=1 Tax=Engelhardtia mirabilis TaxID=2528011 RepID=A0A518BGQ8_9BACT|nr:hypothetical protein Pla133_12270 [Planctomycetes bacterium Pla133]QDV00488.1 hypothetical protein Pla86_12270 [Planctomycetes bacterium Pla86]